MIIKRILLALIALFICCAVVAYSFFAGKYKNADNNLPVGTSQTADITYDQQSVLLYKIWVRSFNDTNGDGLGDLKGITLKLPYLKELGVTSLLLSPIFPSPAYHGYEVTDYQSLSEIYGSLAEFKELVNSASESGIDIVLDLPINHTSDQHPWFVASQDEESPYRDFYVWSEQPISGYGLPWTDSSDEHKVFHTKAGSTGHYYGVFGYASPDLNFRNESVVNQILNSLEFWLDLGVKGFRIDAARYLVEEGALVGQRDTYSNLQLLAKFNSFIKQKNKDAYLIGEVYADAETQSLYNQELTTLDFLFNFEFGLTIADITKSSALKPIQKSVAVKDLYDYLSVSDLPYNRQIVFFENHDLPRSNFASDNSAFLAQSLLLTSPFTPSLYYGNEIGLKGFEQQSDLFFRGPMLWEGKPNTSPLKSLLGEDVREVYSTFLEQQNANEALYQHIANAIKLRSAIYGEAKQRSINFDLSYGSFLVATVMAGDKLSFVAVNLDTSSNQSFSFGALPAQKYENYETGNILSTGDSIDIEPGRFIALGIANEN